MKDKKNMMEFWRDHWGKSSIGESYGLIFTSFAMILGAFIGVISTGVLLDGIENNHPLLAAGFIAACSWGAFSTPYIIYKANTHIPRKERKALERAQQQEIELRALRVREAELGLEPYDLGNIQR